jgi:hypothetical protein
MDVNNLPKIDTLDELAKVVAAGVKIAHCDGTYDTAIRWAEVKKINKKSVEVTVHDYGYYNGDRTMWWKMDTLYGGPATDSNPERLTNYGKESTGWLVSITTDEMEAVVNASYQARKDAAEAKTAKLRKENEERIARIAKERADALAANPGIDWRQIGSLGDMIYYQASMRNERGNVCFVIAGIQRKTETEYVVDPATGDETRTKVQVWQASVNYSEYRPDSSSGYIGTMASCSDPQSGKTLDEAFENVIVRVW